MKISLKKNNKLYNNGDSNKKIKFSEKEYLKAVKIICEDIEKKYKNKKKRIGLLGIARGGVPLLISVSHNVEIRELNIVQVKMTNTNKRWDYGEPEILNYFINDDIDEFIIFEDMVSHARSLNLVIEFLKKKNKKILDVYTLFMNNDMFSIPDKFDDVNINYVNLIKQSQWVFFFWEKGYLDED